ncbi:hypothetical protein, partial [Escherichia coli]|uniref:hypothetical protein n=1 Tax=Escherichia coli TaxID=562 RepID=UPI0032DB284C
NKGPKGPKVTTRRVNGEPIDYVPYEHGSGKKWEECNIPPYWKNKHPMDRFNFLRDHNERIYEQRKKDKEIFRIQQEEQKKFEKVVKELEDANKITKAAEGQTKMIGITQILSAMQQSFSDGMNAPELIAWWDWES